jgi:hypothetical protein
MDFQAANVVWNATVRVESTQDYTTSDSKKLITGIVQLPNRAEVAEIKDVSSHKIDLAEGIVLAGEHAIGEYIQDSKRTVKLGFVSLPPTTLTGVACSVQVTFSYPPGESPEDGSCLFFMGDGWDSHFSIRHVHGGKLQFQVCPTQNGSWGERIDIVSSTAIVGRVEAYIVLAVLHEDGTQSLYLDGVLESQGKGIQGLTHKRKTQVLTHCREQHNFIGRWMRPDQSPPLWAGIHSVQIYDGVRLPK